MKHNNIYKKVFGALMIALAFVACNDKWSDHYDVASSGEGTLWQAISENENLSNFARVVKACGYDTALVGRQVFTVFAPTNDKFTSQMADELIDAYNTEKGKGVKENDNSTVKEFVQNHIALYNYSVSSVSNDSIVMMNGKYLSLTPTTFGEQPILSSNQLYGNGILFTLGNKVEYFPNVFEYLGKDGELKNISDFLYSYNRYKFNEEQSVPGGIVNGKTVYLDSVMTLENELVGTLVSEDSTYWMVVPTNEVWDSLVTAYSPYFNYDNSINKRDSLAYTNARMAIIRGAVFSRSENTDASLIDSAVSVNAVKYENRKYYYGSYDAAYYQYDKPYAPGNVFDGTVNTKCSNGQIMKTNKWNIDKKQTFFQRIIVEGEGAASLDSVDKQTTRAPLTTITVQTKNPYYDKVSDNSYVEILPSGTSRNTKAVFNIPQVLSNIGYDIYVVMVPALAGDTAATKTERLPTKFRCSLSYNDQSGKSITTAKILQSSMVTHADVIDTMLVGKNVMIPTCSWGSNINPQVKLILETRVSSSELNSGKFNRIMRLDCILFKPHEE